jgi:hypothetical protein
MPTHLILYSRSYCHLCDDMREALDSLSGPLDFSLQVIDIDKVPGLLALYDEKVPVLVALENEEKGNGNAQILCHYFLDHEKLIDYLKTG